MRSLLIACAAGVALLSAGSALPGPAGAMPLAPVAAPSNVDTVAQICPRCRPYGECGTARPCGWWAERDRDGVYVFVRPNHGWYRFQHQPSYHPWTYRSGYSYDPYGWSW